MSSTGSQRPTGEQRTLLPADADTERIRSQQKLIADEVAQRYGARLTGELSDLDALQRVIDEQVFPADKTNELQSMGLCLGEVMVKQLGFHWITVEDEYGQDPAIQFGETSIIVFPLTMISKRVERGETVDVRDLYEQTKTALTTEGTEDSEENGFEERHPADTLNDGSVAKLIFFLPALVLHTAIAALAIPMLCGLAVRLLMLPYFVMRSAWATAAIYYVLAIVAGVAWSRRLDRWLFGTSRWVWIVPTLWLLVRMIGAGSFDRALSTLAHTVVGIVVFLLPFVCASGYTVGAWIRRSSGDDVAELDSAVEANAAHVPVKSIWAKTVELWRAGRRA